MRVFRFVTEGTVEERIIKRAARKLKMDHLLMQGGKFNQANDSKKQKMDANEMLKMIRHGAQHIINTCEDEEENMEANIDQILAMS